MNSNAFYKKNKVTIAYFPRQSLKRCTVRVKSSDSIFFLLGITPIINQFDIKSN